MEIVRNLFHGKDRPSWTKLCDAWYELVHSDFIPTGEFSSLKYKDWNPWEDWCQSWVEFKSSNRKTPKSEKLKAHMFSQLSTIAEMTRDKLKEAKTKAQENQSLINQNFAWQKQCVELKRELDAEKQARMENVLVIKISLEKEVKTKDQEIQSLMNRNFALKTQCDHLQRELDIEKQMRIENDLVTHRNKEKEVGLKKSLEVQVKQKEELEKALTKYKEPENKISALIEYCSKLGIQINLQPNNIIGNTSYKLEQLLLRSQFTNEKGEILLTPDCRKEIVDKLGQVTHLNVFEWLYNLKAEYINWQWSQEDFELILWRCMDTSIFNSILPQMRKSHLLWIEKSKYIAESFIPDLDDLLDQEKMREADTVLVYFHRMWTIHHMRDIYRNTSTDHPEYKRAICEGLLPHLYKKVKYFIDEDYDSIEQAALSAERSGLQNKDERQNAQRAGAGCPPRWLIWKRLQKYPVPYEKIHGASYLTLLGHLSRYEDIRTGEPR